MHDALGKKLKVGDHVIVTAKIVELYETEEFCNVSVETTLGRRPDGTKERISAINTGVLIKVEEGE